MKALVLEIYSILNLHKFFKPIVFGPKFNNSEIESVLKRIGATYNKLSEDAMLKVGDTFTAWKSELLHAFQFAKKNFLFQVGNHPKSSKIFNNKYPFFTHKSKFMSNHFKEFFIWLQKNYLKKNDNIIEIGSNDGTFSSYFSKKNYHIIVYYIIILLYPENILILYYSITILLYY